METRELLELAAKACGKSDWVWCEENRAMCNFNKSMRNWYKDYYGNRLEWNPYKDSGDGAEMEAQLELNVEWCSDIVVSQHHRGRYIYEFFKDHPSKQAARRMASLRAAAAIGEMM